jgi:hypothetical protein
LFGAVKGGRQRLASDQLGKLLDPSAPNADVLLARLLDQAVPNQDGTELPDDLAAVAVRRAT